MFLAQLIRLVLVIALCSNFTSSSSASIGNREHVEKYVGESVTFSCDVENQESVLWDYRNTYSGHYTEFINIYTGWGGFSPNYNNSRFTVNFSSTERGSSLVVTQLIESDSGWYTCTSTDNGQVMLTTNLIVLHANHARTTTRPSSLSTTQKQQTTTTTSMHPAATTETVAQLSFVSISRNETVAVLRHADRLNCTSDGRPEPTYMWLVGNQKYTGREFTVDICQLRKSLLTGTEQSRFAETSTPETTVELELECFARIGSRSMSAPTRVVNVSLVLDDPTQCATDITKTSEMSTQNLLIVIVCGVVLPVLIAAIVVAIVFRRHCSKTNGSGRGRSTEPEAYQNSEVILPELATYAEVLETFYSDIGQAPVYDDATTGVNDENIHGDIAESTVRQYEDLRQETREPPAQPSVYSKLLRITDA